MKIWKHIEGGPIWLLRSVVLVVGFVDVAGIAFMITAFLFNSGPLVNVTARNETANGVSVQFDSGRPAPVASLEQLKLTDNAKGWHRIGIHPVPAGSVAVDFHFYTDRWGNAFSVDLTTPEASGSGP